jgi:hypothetical protein
MLKGIRLTLMMGPGVAVPVPKPVTEALREATVTVAAGQRSGFQLVFDISSKSILNTLMTLVAQAPPVVRVILVATVNGDQDVLMDGVVLHHRIVPDPQTGRSTLTVSGEDLTAMMDLFEFTGIPYPAMPAEARVALVIAKYAIFGMIPLVIPSIFFDLPIPTDRIPVHQGTDLAYVQDLAKQAGHVFFLDPGPVPGTNTAYWGPDIRVGIPQPALNIGMDSFTNTEQLSFSYDASKSTLPVVYIQNALTKIPIPLPIPGVSLLSPPLGAIPPGLANIRFLKETAKMSPMQALNTGLAAAAESQDAVTAEGSLDVVRYGRILKARKLVGVRGAGLAYDGLYYVKSVTHRIKRGEFKQSFSLTRNGLVSITPRVPA